jgi:hypothetical protein
MRYNNKKTVKFMKGKYKFNYKTGKEFCSSKCENDETSKKAICFEKGIKECHSCSFKGSTKDEKGKDSEALCKIACKSINDKKCDFYAYLDDDRKVINKRLLNRFGRIFVKNFIKKMK